MNTEKHKGGWLWRVQSSLVNVFEFEALDCLGFIYSTKILLPLPFASLSGSKH
jgi:hypothetical protein